MTDAVAVKIISIDVEKHIIGYIYNGDKRHVKYMHIGDKTSLAVPEAYEGIVFYNNSKPLVAFISVRSEYLEKLKERNANFQCGIVA